MCKPILILGAFAVFFVATAYSQRLPIIYPTYRPPPQPPSYPIRIAREAGVESLRFNGDDELTQLTTEDRPSLLSVDMDPIRHVRSLSTPSSGRRSGSSSSKGSTGHDTGPTHPGYNRRNTRSVTFPTLLPPFNPRPKPWNPPSFPIPMPQRPRFPIYV